MLKLPFLLILLAALAALLVAQPAGQFFIGTPKVDSLKIMWSVPQCGDSRIDPGEECDDGNKQSGDGCFSCQIEGKTAYWPLDTDAQDASGNANHGTLNGGPGFVPGKIGNALQTDGIDDYASVNPATLPIYPDGTYTVAFWGKGTLTGQKDKRIYSEGSSTNGNPLFTLGTGTSDTSKARAFIRDDNANILLGKETTAIVFDGAWHHVAFVDNNSAVALYVDGLLDSTASYTPGTLTLNRVALAAQLKSSPSQFFSGLIDDPRVYSRPLSSQEIAWLFSYGGSPVCGNEVCEGNEASTCPQDCTHLECNTITETCDLVSGSGTDTCSSNNDCTGGGYQCGDTTCDPGESCSSCPEDCGACAQCEDTIDNDNDQAKDYPADFSCSSSSDNDETNPKAQCQDGVDNDGDGFCDTVGSICSDGSAPGDPGCFSKQDNSELDDQIRLSCEETAALPGASGKIWWIDPATGSDANNGSKAKPWKTLGNVADDGKFTTTIKSGDVVCLLNGDHDNTDPGEDYVSITNVVYTSPVTIMAQKGHADVVMGKLEITSVQKIIVDGVQVSPTYAKSPYAGENNFMVVINNGQNVIIKNSELFTDTDEASNTWSESDWINKPVSGMWIKDGGSGTQLMNNYVHNVFTGLRMKAPEYVTRANRVDRFTGDGIMGGPPDAVIEDNVVSNVIDVSDFHQDGIQISVSNGNPPLDIYRQTIRRNKVYETLDPNKPLADQSKQSLQGITAFDDFVHDSVIENNIVITDHIIGIRYSRDMPGTTIMGNTVYGYYFNNPGDYGGSGLAAFGTGGIVWNNLVTSINTGRNDASSNIVVIPDDMDGGTDANRYFIDHLNNDFHLKFDAPAVDAGGSPYFPPTDFEGDSRPQGPAPDVGADEYKP